MSSRKRHRVPKKLSLRARILIYACLLVAPTALGGACGALTLATPPRATFGDARTNSASQPTTAPNLVRSTTLGATGGGIVGVLACIAYTWASRQKKKTW